MNRDLLDKSVIVTGAGRGIGRAVALHVAQAGAAVLVNDIDAALVETLAEEIRRAGGRALALAGPVNDWDFAARLTSAALESFGRLDGLVNNAGLHYQRLPWEENEAELRRMVEVNVLGPLYCGIPALRHFVQQRCGSLINVSSGAHLGVSGHGSYGATKGAVASLTYGWAVDAQAYGVRVNAIAPLARTRMTDALAQYDEKGGTSVAAPDALAPLFTYLLSDRSSAINGQLLRCSGREIGVMRHPDVPQRNHVREHWDVESIAELFAAEVELQPVGLAARAASARPD